MSSLVVEEEIAEETTIETVAEDESPEASGNVDEGLTKDDAEKAAIEPSETETTEEIDISIGDESLTSEKEDAPSWVKEVRENNRKLARRNKELEQLNTQREVSQAPTLGKKPIREDFNWDDDAFDTATEQWYTQKTKVESFKLSEDSKAVEVQKDYQKKFDNYAEQRESLKLKVKNYDEAEQAVRDSLDVGQQSIIVENVTRSAHMIKALGDDMKELDALSKIKDPVQFAFAVGRLEKDLKVTKRRKPTTQPEGKVSGSASSSGVVNSSLEKLRDEARKSGNYTKVAAYRKQHNI
jgi:hypothetical protein